jgi:hypothetical protein
MDGLLTVQFSDKYLDFHIHSTNFKKTTGNTKVRLWGFIMTDAHI